MKAAIVGSRGLLVEKLEDDLPSGVTEPEFSVVIAFWDRHSHGTKYVIDHAKQCGKRVIVYCPSQQK